MMLVEPGKVENEPGVAELIMAADTVSDSYCSVEMTTAGSTLVESVEVAVDPQSMALCLRLSQVSVKLPLSYHR